MKQMLIVPAGWPCSLRECPPGPFVFEDNLNFKSEYRRPDGRVEAYNSGGEFFSRPESTIVQPVKTEWREEE